LIEPVLEECAKKWLGTVVVGKYDVESGNDEVKVELLIKGVMPQSLPALILVHKNKVLATHKGIIRSTELHAMLERHVNESHKELAIVAASSKESHRRKSGLISFVAAGGGDDYMLRQI
jgi:thioredoxin-like negative regulator of GroEL